MGKKITAGLCCGALAFAIGAGPATAGLERGWSGQKCANVQIKYVKALEKGKNKKADRLLRKLEKNCLG